MSTAVENQVFLLPDLGEGLTEAEIVSWLVDVGDIVAVDQPVVEVETAKSIVEVPTPFGGRVLGLHGETGEVIAVGQPLITVVGEETGSRAARQSVAETYSETERAGSGNVLIGYGTSHEGARGRRRAPRPRASAQAARQSPRKPAVTSPAVRRLARDGGLRLEDIAPTGAGGVITRADVVTALAASEPTASMADLGVAPAASLGERRMPLTGFRKTVAAQLSRSRTEIPEATVWVDVDATALWELRESTRTADDAGPGLLAYLARFVVAGLGQYPVLNSRFDHERQEIVEHEHVHLGIAVQSDRGLVVPAVPHAERSSTEQLDRLIGDLTTRARAGRASAEELSSGTFTLNNYGGLGVDGSAAIINHPQVAILGFGRILDRPWVVDGQIVIRKIAQMSFVFDHRVCDGGTAAGFMRLVADAIEDPLTAIRKL